MTNELLGIFLPAIWIVSQTNQYRSCNGTFESRSFRQACAVWNEDSRYEIGVGRWEASERKTLLRSFRGRPIWPLSRTKTSEFVKSRRFWAVPPGEPRESSRKCNHAGEGGVNCLDETAERIEVFFSQFLRCKGRFLIIRLRSLKWA